MGKSDKKSKSEKIKALRKRYDAFLEEDKKRKERNDYILERLEKMRSCVTLVQVRCKGYLKDENDYHGGMIKAIDGPRQTYVKSDYEKRYEPKVLKEISQKYILIPKASSNHSKNVNNSYDKAIQDPTPVQSPSSDSDWKSKYSILDELKREEKGENPKVTYEKRNEHDDYNENIKNQNVFKANTEQINYENKKTENRDCSSNKLERNENALNKENRFNREETNYDMYKEIKPENTENLNIKATSALSTEREEIPLNKNENYREVRSTSNDLPPENYQVEVKQDQISDKSNIKEEKDSKNNLYEKFTEEQQPTAICEDKYLPEEKTPIEIETKSPENLVQATTNLSPVVNQENVNVDVKGDPLSYVNNQEIIQNENLVTAQTEEVEATLKEEPTIDVKEHHEYEQNQESNIQPVENLVNNVSENVNDEFEAEQNEMFYDETGDAYKQNDATGYTQEGENYANQEYSNYYEDIQKEQIYPIEINEHEETNERYDANYAEQYNNNYDGTNETEYQTQQYNVDEYNQLAYEQGDNYQEHIQNYESTSVKEADREQYNDPTNVQPGQPNIAYTQGYETQQEYIPQEAPAIEKIEQQLDIEDEYIPNPNMPVDNKDYEDNIKETAEIKQPDVNVI